jgi:hypothetical protein
MKPGRNDACHCGSGRKYKKCCEAADEARESASASTNSSPTGGTASAPEAAPSPASGSKHREPLGSWMHQSRAGKPHQRRSQVGKDSLG